MSADTEAQLSQFKSLLLCFPAENDNIDMDVMRIKWDILYSCRVPMVGYYYFWKQHKSSSVQEWLNKQWCVHSNECCASVKTSKEGLFFGGDICVLI